MAAALALTVIGGYLGAGKTTLVNRLLRSPGGRRIGVIVNDFGSVAIDADLLAGATTDGDVIGLANGCVCCTVGAGLHEALGTIAERDVDHVVIEVSGVADPAVAAAWGTVPPFEPAGIVVLVAADQILRLRRDRYVGVEVRRQVAGADLLLVTKGDRCDDRTADDVDAWLASESDAPRIEVIDGEVPVDLVLGARPEVIVDRAHRGGGPGRASGPVAGQTDGGGDGVAHERRYVSWSWSSSVPIGRAALGALVAGIDPRVLRLKGWVALDDGSTVVVQVVGRTVDVRVAPPGDVAAVAGRGAAGRSDLVAIALAGAPNPFALHFG